MSINACSINEHTINTLCGRRRQTIIDWLLPPVVVVTGGGQQQHVHPDTTLPLNMFRRDAEREENVVEVDTLELPYMTVTIEVAGQTYLQTLERDDTVPMVTVFSIKGATCLEQVNISDINIRII